MVEDQETVPGPSIPPVAAAESPGVWWRSRPRLSLALRIAVFVGPAVASLAVAELVSKLLPHPIGPASMAAWWVLVTAVALLALLVAERGMRQLLPLAALLQLSMLYPDHAPQRFAIARQAGRPQLLIDELNRVHGAAAEGDLRVAQTVLELAAALSVHDRKTRGHSERVRALTDMITAELHLPEHDRAKLRWAALLHDIGKISVPGRILNKPGPPDQREWRVLRAHPDEGARLVAPILPWLGQWGLAVVEHHEWVNGQGYPRELRENQISLGARIVSVADIYETITAVRPYRRPVGVRAARAELVRVSGTQLDPVIVRAFLNVSVGRLWRVVGLGAIVSQVPLVADLTGFAARTVPGLGASTAAAGAAGALAIGGAGLGPMMRPANVLASGSPTPTPSAAVAPARSARATSHPRVAGLPPPPPAPGNLAPPRPPAPRQPGPVPPPAPGPGGLPPPPGHVVPAPPLPAVFPGSGTP